MKKFYILTIALVLIITITGCGKTKNKEPEKTEFTLGEKIEIKNFEIEFLNYSLRKAISEKENKQNTCKGKYCGNGVPSKIGCLA